MGKCRGHDPALFFPISNQSDRLAKRLCSHCPVVAQCMDYAIEHNEVGVWGGTNERERKRIAARYIRPYKALAHTAISR